MLTNFLVPTSIEKSGLHCKINKTNKGLNNKTLLIFYTVSKETESVLCVSIPLQTV